MATPSFIRVLPRVVDDRDGGTVPLIDRVRALLADGRPQVVCLRGEGKTMALRYIAEVFASQVAEVRMPLAILDEEFSFGENSQNSLLLTSNLRPNAEQTLTLASWGEDEFIEYLLANHPAQCATVMQQLGKYDLNFARGSPYIWRPLLAALVADPKLSDPQKVAAQQFQRALAEQAPNWSLAELADLFI